jgi:signal transduction histidine kinase
VKFLSKIVWVAVISLLVTEVAAQSFSRIDSLRSLVNTSTGEQKFSHLNNLGFEFRLSYPDSTIYYCEMAYSLGNELQLKRGLSRPLSFIGLAYAYKGDYQSSFDYHTRAIEIAEAERDSSQLAFGYNNFGRLFFDQGDMVRAYNNFLKARVIFEDINDKFGLSYVNRSLSNLYKSQHDYDKALALAQSAYQLRKDLGDPRGILSALMELGLVYQDVNDTTQAMQSLYAADSIANEINDQISHAEIYLALSDILFAQGQQVLACRKSEEAFRIIQKSNNQRLLPRGNLQLGRCAFENRDYGSAIRYFSEVIRLSESTGNIQLQQDANFYLSDLYRRINNQSKAIEHSNRYLVLKETLQNVDLTRQIERLQFQLEIEKKEKENELLLVNQKANEALISEQRLQNLLLVIVVVFISLLAFIQWRNSKKRKVINERLSLQKSEIEKQREEIVNQNGMLFKRNARLSELNHEKDMLMSIVAHDLKSPLNRIKGLSDILELDSNLTPEQRTYIRLMKDSTRAGLDLIKDLLDVHMLEENVEPTYSRFDLPSLVFDKIESHRGAANEKGIMLNIDRIPPVEVGSDKEYVSRIVDNLVTNAIKFCDRNGLVQVSAGKLSNTFWIRVKDNGPGFSDTDKVNLYQKFKRLSARPTAGESSNGLGLAIVKTLVDRLEGEIVLTSAPKAGSEFQITLPDRVEAVV